LTAPPGSSAGFLPAADPPSIAMGIRQREYLVALAQEEFVARTALEKVLA
jgi:hypothetical protein